MDAKDYLVNHVLGDGRRFMVPIYQRQYQWGQDRLEPFWEDVVAKADDALAGTSRFQHYLGALILAPGGDGYAVGVTPRVLVIDGQQRLTTFQILLAALREVARDRNVDGLDRRIDDYLFNPPKAADQDPLARYKLCPTPRDRELFHDVIAGPRDAVRAKYARHYFSPGRVRKVGTPTALLAYEYLLARIDDYARFGLSDASTGPGAVDIADGDDDPMLAVARLDALQQGLLAGMKLVVITLDEGDDAQVIFETLNRGGAPRVARDLVRNNIFHRAERQGEGAERLYHDLWEAFDAPWWREDAPRARPRRPRIDHFLSHVLTAETGRATAMRELYAEYRAFARPKGKARFERVEDELAILTAYAPAYEMLEGRGHGDPTISWLGRKLAAWEVTTAYPVALRLANSAVEEPERTRIARLLYSYIVRRALCGLTPKNLNGVFQRIAERFNRQPVSLSVLTDTLNEPSGPAVRFPGDDELRDAVRTNPVYEWLGGGRLPDVLWELELASRGSYAEALARPEGLWIEHVMPQSWQAHWPLDTRSPDGATASEQERNRRVHKLGNLTLTTDRLNLALSNEGFESKRAMLQQHSLLALNATILRAETWDDAAIESRGAALAELAIAVWPKPAR